MLYFRSYVEGKVLFIRRLVFILLYVNFFFIILLVIFTYICSFSFYFFDIILDFNIFLLLSFKNYFFEF